jgi:hypothetical protein
MEAIRISLVRKIISTFSRGLHRTIQENTMPQSTHDRAAELHSLAEHAHASAAAAHAKADHLTAHELSKKAFEYSQNALRLSEQLAEEAEKPTKA